MLNRTLLRKKILIQAGAKEEQLEELLAYNQNPFDHSKVEELHFPLADEPFISNWENYVEVARKKNLYEALLPIYHQLKFPIQEGMSKTNAYQLATQQGILPLDDPDHGKALIQKPKQIECEIMQFPAGRIPVLRFSYRPDFVTMIRAFAAKNEPYPIPDSMGAAMIQGIYNWERIRLHQVKTKEAVGDIVKNKNVFQDRFMLIAKGPYSGVHSSNLGLSEQEWNEISAKIRIYHESAHYFTYRVFGKMNINLLDELIADYYGIRKACGHFRSELFLWGMGLEHFPKYREGGRMQNYCQNMSSEAFVVQQKILYIAAKQLEKFDLTLPQDSGSVFEDAALLLAICEFTLEELASDQGCDLLQRANQKHLTQVA